MQIHNLDLMENLLFFRSCSFKKALFCLALLSSVQSNEIRLKCDFKTYSDGYNCQVNNLKIDLQNIEITSVDGKHEGGKENTNVDCFYITSSNCIKYLPANISKFFENLTKLQVFEGALKYIAQSDFAGLKSLKTIEIRKNLISTIPENTFIDVKQLKKLILSDNKIQTLESKTFENLPELKQIWLSGNMIETLPSLIFEKNLKLVEIRLSNNKLRIIDSEVLNPLKYLTFVFLDGNSCISKSFPNDLSLNELKAEFSVKCTNESEIVKSSRLVEMNHEITALQLNVTASDDKIKQLDEKLAESLLLIKLLETDKQKLVEQVDEFKLNLKISKEQYLASDSSLNETRTTNEQLKESYETLNETCLTIETNLRANLNEKISEGIEAEILCHNTMLKASENFNFLIKTAFLVAASLLTALIIVVFVLMCCMKNKRVVKLCKINETEMEINNENVKYKSQNY